MKEKKDEKIKSKSKKNKKKSPLVKFFIIIFIILLLLIIAFLVFKLNEFTKLAKEMFNNVPSTVYDTNNSVIAQIGTERNRKKYHGILPGCKAHRGCTDYHRRQPPHHRHCALRGSQGAGLRGSADGYEGARALRRGAAPHRSGGHEGCGCSYLPHRQVPDPH